MRRIIISICVVLGSVVLVYLALGYLSNYIGWYGYKKWEHRIGTRSIEESIQRGIFVKKLNFSSDVVYKELTQFSAYIERGFRYSKHSSDSTIPITDSQFPYQLGFNTSIGDSIMFSIMKSDLIKFDSSDAAWGYLKEPKLSDTIKLKISIRHKSGNGGTIKVW